MSTKTSQLASPDAITNAYGQATSAEGRYATYREAPNGSSAEFISLRDLQIGSRQAVAGETYGPDLSRDGRFIVYDKYNAGEFFVV